MLANAGRSQRLSIALVPLGVLFAVLGVIVSEALQTVLGAGVAILGVILYFGFSEASSGQTGEKSPRSERMLHIGYFSGVIVFYFVIVFLAKPILGVPAAEILTVPPLVGSVVVSLLGICLSAGMIRKLARADHSELTAVYEYEGVALLAVLVLLLVAPALSWLFIVVYLLPRVLWFAT